MSFLGKVTGHHEDEKKAVEDALPTQKLRKSVETRIYNFEKLVREETPEIPEQHQALADLTTARRSLENLLDKIDVMQEQEASD